MTFPVKACGAALVALSVGCHPEPGPPEARPIDASVDSASDDGGDGGPACDQSGTPVDIDLLIVVGNGERSGATQISLWNSFPVFLERLGCEVGAPINLHAGVVSTNLGAGGFDVPRCTGNGDDGTFTSSAKIAGCDPFQGAFLTDVDDGSGRTKNFSESAPAALECVGFLGTNGCTFEQPLEAAIRATDGVRNPGFLRDNAVLGILFAGGGDDCSAASSDLFDPDEADTLGPLSAFRCFEHGVECNPDEPRTVGDKDECAPRTGPLVTPVLDLAATLVGRKADPADVVIGTLGGLSSDVTVFSEDGQLALDSACPPPLDVAPTIRLSAIPDAINAVSCFPSPSNLSPLADAIAAAATR